MSGSKLTQMPLAELLLDNTLYPRHATDDHHVQQLAQALEAGATLPPIVADAKSKRITDGWHRHKAYKRFIGPTAVVDVELVKYTSDAEMVIDAVARNARHGRRLDAMDRTRSVLMLQNAGCNNVQIACALNVTEERVVKLTVKVAKAPKSSPHVVPGTSQVTLKRSVSHMEGMTLTKAQADTHAKLPGTSFLLPAKQICLALSENMINLEDVRLVAQLTELRDLLIAKLP